MYVELQPYTLTMTNTRATPNPILTLSLTLTTGQHRAVVATTTAAPRSWHAGGHEDRMPNVSGIHEFGQSEAVKRHR